MTAFCAHVQKSRRPDVTQVSVSGISTQGNRERKPITNHMDVPENTVKGKPIASQVTYLQVFLSIKVRVEGQAARDAVMKTSKPFFYNRLFQAMQNSTLSNGSPTERSNQQNASCNDAT